LIFYENFFFETMLHLLYVCNSVSNKKLRLMNAPFYQLLILSGFLLTSFTVAHETSNLELVDGITDVTLTFTPKSGGNAIIASAKDPDGTGPQTLQVVNAIELKESTEYTLSILVENKTSGANLSQEIQQNSADYQLFFGWEESIIASPNGDGNLDNSSDVVKYVDFDNNNRPLGLTTSWTTACGEGNLSGDFRIILKHQPGIKSDTTGIGTGMTDFDLTWNFNVQEDPNAPPCENEEEIITDVTLTFTPDSGGEPVIARAQDPDGEGPLDLIISGQINLMESTRYTMDIKIENRIEGEDITEEIREEDEDHLFFFSWTEGLFSSPVGNGNIDNRSDDVNYNDFDENGLPVGLSTDWTTVCGGEVTSGKFRLVLKHQPDLKSATSSVNDGGTDLDLEWDIAVAIDPDAPPCENEEEIITDVTLTFTPTAGGDPVVATASDPDGEGPLDLTINGPINLIESTDYDLSIKVENKIEGEDITEEIMEEDDEHMFFFSWTDAVFTSPAGDGNIDNRADPVGYLDFDENGQPVGLSTEWTSGMAGESGTFRLVLKHQPDAKSATSTVEEGGTDLDLEWAVNTVISTSIQEQMQRNAALRLYPNPTSGKLWWEIEGRYLNDVQVRIFDQTGRVISIVNPDNNQLDLSQLSRGLFTLQIVSEGEIWTKRFMKQ
jgi:Trk K+ transport system NAD-binding subunit